jgi:hypothetical protein
MRLRALALAEAGVIVAVLAVERRLRHAAGERS